MTTPGISDPAEGNVFVSFHYHKVIEATNVITSIKIICVMCKYTQGKLGKYQSVYEGTGNSKAKKLPHVQIHWPFLIQKEWPQTKLHVRVRLAVFTNYVQKEPILHVHHWIIEVHVYTGVSNLERT